MISDQSQESLIGWVGDLANDVKDLSQALHQLRRAMQVGSPSVEFVGAAPSRQGSLGESSETPLSDFVRPGEVYITGKRVSLSYDRESFLVTRPFPGCVKLQYKERANGQQAHG